MTDLHLPYSMVVQGDLIVWDNEWWKVLTVRELSPGAVSVDLLHLSSGRTNAGFVFSKQDHGRVRPLGNPPEDPETAKSSWPPKRSEVQTQYEPLIPEERIENVLHGLVQCGKLDIEYSRSYDETYKHFGIEHAATVGVLLGIVFQLCGKEDPQYQYGNVADATRQYGMESPETIRDILLTLEAILQETQEGQS